MESLLLHRSVRRAKISLKYFQVVEKICEKTLLVKCLLAEDLGVTWFTAVCFLCGARVALYSRFVCCFTQRTGIFFPWTSEYELIPFSCMRIWNI